MALRNKRMNPNAFPGSPYGDAAEGMELRDYLAGQALTGMLADADGTPTPEVGARICYQWADAMLAARVARSAAR